MDGRISRRLGSWVLAVALATVGATSVLPAQAVVQPEGRLVSEVAASRTPHVLDGIVYSVARVGDQVVLGGTFSRARDDGSTAELGRTGLLAFDAATGRINTSFVPQPNGRVNVVLAAPDGQSVFVGGRFTSIGGVERKNLAQVRLSDGAVLPFDAGRVTGMVNDLALAGERLWLAGNFTHVAGHDQPALATVSARSGGFLPFMRLRIAGTHNGGHTGVEDLDITPGGERLVAIGNFDTLDGVVRRQLLQLDIGGEAARETTFNTRFYTSACASAFDSYVRDVDYSPDGTYFVVATTGGYGGPDAACDTTARFETWAQGPAVEPSWVNQTGGDTTHSVEVLDSVVYVGGHFRWQNNPYARDAVGPGAVPRDGIAALDPSNGLPYSWNPGRTRGIGVFDFLMDESGLWITSDTDRIGAFQYKGRVARMPHTGTSFPAVRSAELPNDVYRVGALDVTARSYRGGDVGPARTVPGLSASSVRGAFMVNGWLYVAQSDGTFTRRTFDGTTFGTPEPVDTADRLSADTAWRDDVRHATGMFYDNGRIYFTRSGSNELRYRYFTAESGVVGARRMVAARNVAGLDLSGVRGMFVADEKLHWSDTNGVLHRIDWREAGPSGVPVGGTATAVSGPALDGVDWSARDLFLFQDARGRGAPMPPEASFSAECTSLTCAFDGSSSLVPGGAVQGWSWSFGDGASATGPEPVHSYAAAGDYTVTLTITSDRGGSATTTRKVSVKRVNQPPTAAFTASCQAMACSFDGRASTDADGPLAYAWDLGDGTTATGPTPTHVYAAEGTRRVRLVVTDADGATATASQEVTATLARVSFAGAAAVNANAATHRLQLPADLRPGDLMVLQLALNSDVAVTDPDGWTRLESLNGGGVAGRAWSRRVTEADLGGRVAVALGAVAKGDLSVLVYRGTGGRRAVVADHRGRIDTARGTEHVSPQVTVPAGGGWLTTYWALKASSDAWWGDIGGQTARAGSSGGGGGRISATAADSDGAVAPGTAGGIAGRTTVEVPRAIMFSTVIGLE